MAVVFISPRQRQRKFFSLITLAFLLLVLLVFSFVFYFHPGASTPTLRLNKPKVTIDMSIFDSEQFKDLQSFAQMQIQFSYQGLTKDHKQQEGIISAASLEEARAILESSGLTISFLKEAVIGRDNPFTPYYQATPLPPVVKGQSGSSASNTSTTSTSGSSSSTTSTGT